jgi:hypothetical protein
MPSPKFDSTSIALSKLLGDPVSSAASNGTWLTASVREAVLNEALQEFFRQHWTAVQGDVKLFAELFPENLRVVAITTTSVGKYTIATASPSFTYDLFKVVDGTLSTQLIRFLNQVYYNTVITGANTELTPSTSNFLAFQMGGELTFLPAASFNAQSVTIAYIRKPVFPSTGGSFTAAGTYDIPFAEIWINEIAALAEEIYKNYNQER